MLLSSPLSAAAPCPLYHQATLAHHSAPKTHPKCCQVELKQDLVSSCVVGDVVTVLGLVKVLATGEQGAGREWARACRGQPWHESAPVCDMLLAEQWARRHTCPMSRPARPQGQATGSGPAEPVPALPRCNVNNQQQARRAPGRAPGLRSAAATAAARGGACRAARDSRGAAAAAGGAGAAAAGRRCFRWRAAAQYAGLLSAGPPVHPHIYWWARGVPPCCACCQWVSCNMQCLCHFSIACCSRQPRRQSRAQQCADGCINKTSHACL
jgi:hypothetical protein